MSSSATMAPDNRTTVYLANTEVSQESSEMADASTIPPDQHARLPLEQEAPDPPERYEDLGIIAAGGMGRVRRVRDRKLNQILAMKILSWDLVDEPRMRERFFNEARMTAALQHPGIVSVHDSGVLGDNRPWFTMTEVRGHTFGQAIATLHADAGTPSLKPPTRLVDSLLRACEAVAYAHSLQIVHRDIKPDNLMLGQFGEVMVMDWGLARYCGSPHAHNKPADDFEQEQSGHAGIDDGAKLTRAHEIVGTPVYMPPEQARGGTEALAPTMDVYALGAVLYVILCGRPPYKGSPAVVLSRLGSRAPPPVSKIDSTVLKPEALCAICERAMAREPRHRFQNAGELAEALRGWLDGTRRRERALGTVARADAMLPQIVSLRRQAELAREEAVTLLEPVRPFDPIARKSPAWALEDRAAQLDQQAELAEVEWLQMLRSAIEQEPDLPDAHQRLADHYRKRVTRAEEQRNPRLALRYEALLRAHDRGRHTAFLSGHGTFSLVTDPPGAHVRLYRYVERERLLVPEPAADLGTTPLGPISLERGSYLLLINAPGHVEVRYPVWIERNHHWSGKRPGTDEAHVIPLPHEASLEDDEVYVPAGFFYAGGDADAGESLPRNRLWLDGFVIQKHPVTNAEYIAFLNDLVARGQQTRALELAPRMQIALSTGGRTAHAYIRNAAGHFSVNTRDEDFREEVDWPVVGVDWHGACAYAAWRSQRTGQSWRLPDELQWEKAARGTDGRFMPWGDFVEPTWACMLESRQGTPGRVSVTEYPDDCSPYGVRGLAGNVRDWCANAWRSSGPQPHDDLAVVEHANAGDETLRSARGGAWFSTASLCRLATRFAAKPTHRVNGLGFRLLRAL